MSFASFFNDAKKKRDNLKLESETNSKRKNTNQTSAKSRKKKKLNNNKNKKQNEKQAQNSALDLLDLVKIHENEIGKRKIQPVSSENKNETRPVSQKALDLSSTLKELSNQKQLKQALKQYYDFSNDNIRDAHHGSIMIDCCSRCGDIDHAEKIFKNMLLEVQKRQKNRDDNGLKQYQISVQAYTALMKGYAHSGQMDKATKLYRIMCTFRSRYSRPNVRTLNTFLRGCLWTASSSSGLTNINRGGGVISSEVAWLLTLQSRGLEFFDYSSYEYSINLLCQALRVQDAEDRIAEMIQNSSLPTDDEKKEALATSYVALARAYALLGNTKSTQKTVKKALDILQSQDKSNMNKNNMDAKNQKKGAIGGKRAWRNRDTNNALSSKNHDQIQSRSLSNQLFRGHRKSELIKEAEAISNIAKLPSKKQVAFLMMTRLLYICGGGTTDLKAIKGMNTNDAINKDNNVNLLANDLINTLWFCFGLSALVSNPTPLTTFFQHFKKNNDNYPSLSKDDMADLESLFDNSDSSTSLQSMFKSEGWMNFDHIFSPMSDDAKARHKLSSRISEKKKPIYLELGAGSGDWIISQANANPNANYISVELRADRVAQTFAKATLNLNYIRDANKNEPKSPLLNLCCCGSECGLFLRKHVPPRSISRIYVNHPEPPTQTGKDLTQDDEDLSAISSFFDSKKELKDDEEESAHMLNSCVINSALNCLKDNGKGDLIIVTDNRWYAFLICKTIVSVINERHGKNEKVNFEQKIFSEPSLRAVEMFPIRSSPTNSNSDLSSHIILYEGQPCPAIGHLLENSSSENARGVSYFDRLWRTGAGRHAEEKTRYIIALQTNADINNANAKSFSNVKEFKSKNNKGKKTKRKGKK